MKVKLENLRPLSKPLAIAIASLVLLTGPGCQHPGPTKSPIEESPPKQDPAVAAYKEAEKRVEEARGEPVGRKAKVTIPKELQHYPDRRRFLAVQYAAWGEFHNEIPQGYLE